MVTGATPAGLCRRSDPRSSSRLRLFPRGDLALVRPVIPRVEDLELVPHCIPDGLEVTLGNSTYRIGRWPDMTIFRWQNGAGRPATLREKAIVFFLLNDLRLGKAPTARRCVYDLVRNVPLAIHVALTPMWAHYFAALQWLAQLPELCALIESSPALFAVVVQYLAVGAIKPEQILDLRSRLLGRQRDLLQWLEFGRCEAQCKILRKCSAYGFDYDEWRAIGHAWSDPAVLRVLEHATFIPGHLLYFLSWDEPRWVLTGAAKAECLAFLLHDPDQPYVDGMHLQEMLGFASLLRKFGVARHPFTSLEALRLAVASTSHDISELNLQPGPLIEYQGLEPISTVGELIAEGSRMSHCVGAMHYISRALRGKTCFYHLSGATEATLSLKREGPDVSWCLDEIRGQANQFLPEPILSSLSIAMKRGGVGRAIPSRRFLQHRHL